VQISLDRIRYTYDYYIYRVSLTSCIIHCREYSYLHCNIKNLPRRLSVRHAVRCGNRCEIITALRLPFLASEVWTRPIEQPEIPQTRSHKSFARFDHFWCTDPQLRYANKLDIAQHTAYCVTSSMITILHNPRYMESDEG